MAQLTCKDVTLGYDGKPVVHGLNFSVEQGDYLCILGENGSGKSTLVKTLLHLHPVMSGKVETGDGLLANEIGYLPQQTLVQRDFPASVTEIVRSGLLGRCGMRPFYTKREKALADENMRNLGISHLSGRCYRELSGGQQQRVLLARALCATRKMLLLDEPVAGLDPNATREMYELVASLNRDDGITIIMVSHDISAAMQYAKHILYIGNPLFWGSTEEFRDSGLARHFQDESRHHCTRSEED